MTSEREECDEMKPDQFFLLNWDYCDFEGCEECCESGVVRRVPMVRTNYKNQLKRERLKRERVASAL